MDELEKAVAIRNEAYHLYLIAKEDERRAKMKTLFRCNICGEGSNVIAMPNEMVKCKKCAEGYLVMVPAVSLEAGLALVKLADKIAKQAEVAIIRNMTSTQFHTLYPEDFHEARN